MMETEELLQYLTEEIDMTADKARAEACMLGMSLTKYLSRLQPYEAYKREMAGKL